MCISRRKFQFNNPVTRGASTIKTASPRSYRYRIKHTQRQRLTREMKYIFPSIDAGVDVAIAISKEKTAKKKVKGRDTFFLRENSVSY